MSESKKPNNELRISFRSKPKQIISQCEKLLKEEKVKDLHLSAIGNTIGNLVITAEIFKKKRKTQTQKCQKKIEMPYLIL